MTLRTAVVGVGHLGKQHARIHSALAEEDLTNFSHVCDLNEHTARAIAAERKVEWTTDWRQLIDRVDAVSLAVPTESHCEIACGLLEAGIHVLVEKPISRTLAEADLMRWFDDHHARYDVPEAVELADIYIPYTLSKDHEGRDVIEDGERRQLMQLVLNFFSNIRDKQQTEFVDSVL